MKKDFQTTYGWGLSPKSQSVVRSVSEVELLDLVRAIPQRGLLARGMGRAYGDAALNSGGIVVEMSSPNLNLNKSTGVLTASGGASLDSVLRVSVPAGWFIPVTPGTRFVSIGGAIAADVHGKNHHHDGSLGAWVISLTIMVASGEVLRASPDENPGLFWATIGGMGLTGIVISAEIQMIPIETSRVMVSTRRCEDLDSTMDSMLSNDHMYKYSVAWVDGTVGGRKLGRSVLSWGEHAKRQDLDAKISDSLAYNPRQVLGLPRQLESWRVLRRWNAAAFSEMWFRKAPHYREGEIQSIAEFFHPLDGVANWNRVYGSRGFIQYQFVVPDSEYQAVRKVLELVVRTRPANFLNVLKRFGSQGEGMLSFPKPGWTLTIDLPIIDSLGNLLHELDEIVLEAGGRPYLAKDAFTKRQVIEEGYPRLREWSSIRRHYDPAGLFQSDLSRRLGL